MGVFCIDDFHGGVYVYASYFMYIQDGMCRLDIDIDYQVVSHYSKVGYCWEVERRHLNQEIAFFVEPIEFYNRYFALDIALRE